MLVYLHRVEPIRTINKFMYLNKPEVTAEDWGNTHEPMEKDYGVLYAICAYALLVALIIGVILMN